MEDTGNIRGLEVYTPKAVFLGIVDDLVVDLANMRIDSLYIQKPSPALVEPGTAIAVPFRWVQSVGDVIILNTFPDRVDRSGPVV